MATYFKFNEGFYRQKHGCTVGSPVSPTVTNLYMEEVGNQVMYTLKGITATGLSTRHLGYNQNPRKTGFSNCI